MKTYSLSKPTHIPVTRTSLMPMSMGGKWMQVMRSTLERVHDRGVFHWEVLSKKPAVVVLPITQEGEMILIDQFRYPIMNWELECSAETMDQEGDTPEGAAARALSEEIGYRTDRLIRMPTYASSGGMTDEIAHTYIALDCIPLESGHDRSSDEIIQVNHVPTDEVDQFLAYRIQQGQILNPKMHALIGAYMRGDFRKNKSFNLFPSLGSKNPFAFRQLPRHIMFHISSLLGQNPGAAGLQSDCKDTVNTGTV